VRKLLKLKDLPGAVVCKECATAWKEIGLQMAVVPIISSQMSPQSIDMQKVELHPWVQKENAARSCRGQNRLAMLSDENNSRLSIEGQGKALPGSVSVSDYATYQDLAAWSDDKFRVADHREGSEPSQYKRQAHL
jgi:hypothetical protein